MSREHGALQSALSAAMNLNRLIEPCRAAGIDINIAAQFESAHVLWDQKEMAVSIRSLQELKNMSFPKTGLRHVSRAGLMTKLVGRVCICFPGLAI